MKNTFKLLGTSLVLATVAGGALMITATGSQAGLKDDRCWEQKPASASRLHRHSCVVFGLIEPNNQENGAGIKSGDFGSTKVASRAPNPGTNPGSPNAPETAPTPTDPTPVDPTPVDPTPEKPVTPEKPNKPEKPEKPNKPEKPEKPNKPEKPENPEGGCVAHGGGGGNCGVGKGNGGGNGTSNEGNGNKKSDNSPGSGPKGNNGRGTGDNRDGGNPPGGGNTSNDPN